jgi:ribonuclease Z
MFSKKLAIATLATVGLFGAAALTLDVNIRLKGDSAKATTTTTGKWSPTKPSPEHEVYYPGTEELKPDEMRVIACGTGMPMPRLKQAAACFLVELGNGDKFIFDMGTGSMERIYALGIPLDFIRHLQQFLKRGLKPLFYRFKIIVSGDVYWIPFHR